MRVAQFHNDREVVTLEEASELAWQDRWIIQYWARFRDIEWCVLQNGTVMYYKDSLMKHAQLMNPRCVRGGG